MKLEVAYRDERNNIQNIECTGVSEGEYGLKLIRNPGKDLVGYIPYDSLERVSPKDE